MKICLRKYQHLRNLAKHFLFIFCLMTIVILPNSVFGKMNMDYTFSPQELEAVPRWCKCRILEVRREFNLKGGKDVPDSVMHESARWAKVIGKDIYVFTHHYCRGLNWINRYKLSLMFPYKNVEADRKYALEEALNQFKFMRGRLRPKHKLYYSMLMNEAYVYGELKNFKKASRNYQEIIKLRPGYAYAYVKYAQLLNSIGRNADAIKVLQIGLKKTKGAKLIKQAMTAMRSAGNK